MPARKVETDTKKSNFKAYEEFYLELPPTEYLQDIEIQDDYEKTTDYPVRGLSDEQVSQIAADSLHDANHTPSKNSTEPKTDSTKTQ
jgi:hypothetical protein